MYRNFKCNGYHIYGDNSEKIWSYKELKEYFNIDGSDCAFCIKDFTGDANKFEYYSFKKDDVVSIMESCFGGFRIK